MSLESHGLSKGMDKLLLMVAIGTPLIDVSGQGTIQFANANVGAAVNAPVYESDGVTKLSGPQFMAELFAGTSSSSLASLARTGFLTGNGAGYFDGGTQTINSVSGGVTVSVQVDVWNTASGSSFAQAQASGLPNSWWQSAVFPVVTGRQGINPTPPGALTGLGTSPVFLNAVPEPSTFALIGLGSAVAFLHIRRHKRPGVLSGKSGWK